MERREIQFQSPLTFQAVKDAIKAMQQIGLGGPYQAHVSTRAMGELFRDPETIAAFGSQAREGVISEPIDVRFIEVG